MPFQVWMVLAFLSGIFLVSGKHLLASYLEVRRLKAITEAEKRRRNQARLSSITIDIMTDIHGWWQSCQIVSLWLLWLVKNFLLFGNAISTQWPCYSYTTPKAPRMAPIYILDDTKVAKKCGLKMKILINQGHSGFFWISSLLIEDVWALKAPQL